jgi:ABC-2 type transport system ATP-binding protein
VADETAHDVVRDEVAGLGAGLLRMERQRHRMTELFTDQPAGAGGATRD